MKTPWHTGFLGAGVLVLKLNSLIVFTFVLIFPLNLGSLIIGKIGLSAPFYDNWKNNFLR